MTDVTGVAIPPDFSSRYQEVSLLTGGFPRQCAHWLGMTVLLFVQFFFSETAPFQGSKLSRCKRYTINQSFPNILFDAYRVNEAK